MIITFFSGQYGNLNTLTLTDVDQNDEGWYHCKTHDFLGKEYLSYFNIKTRGKFHVWLQWITNSSEHPDISNMNNYLQKIVSKKETVILLPVAEISWELFILEGGPEE